MSHHHYDSENDDYCDGSYEYYGSEQYCEEYWPSSSSNYNLDCSDSRDTYTHQSNWSDGYYSSDLHEVDSERVSTSDIYVRRSRSRSHERRGEVIISLNVGEAGVRKEGTVLGGVMVTDMMEGEGAGAEVMAGGLVVIGGKVWNIRVK